MAKTVVILGGSFAGLHVAHYLLKQKISDLKVILVSKNSHFYWNLASVRAIIPGIIKEEQLFQPLSDALAQYPRASYELIVGSADATDFAAKTVTVSSADGGGIQAIPYDQLVLATGSRPSATVGASVPWKAAGTYEEAVTLLRDIETRIAAADRIVVAGAGPTGVEVAGEIAYEYGPRSKGKGKEVILLAAEEGVIDGDSISGSAHSELLKLGVNIKTRARVDNTKPGVNGKTEVVLHNGDTIATDLYLPTMGLVPNSEYVEKEFLGERGFVNVDEFFRVSGAEDVWAAGDIVSKPRAGFMITQKQAAGVAKNVEAALKGKGPTTVRGMPIDIFACSVGRGRGAGRMGSVRLPSLMVWMAKGRTLGMQMLAGYIDGSVA